MTPDELRIIAALQGCSFAPGTSSKRFVRQMRGRTSPLTDRQRTYLWAIAWSWRRQLGRDLAAIAEEYTGGIGVRAREWNEQRQQVRAKEVSERRAAEAPVKASVELPLFDMAQGA